MIVDLEITRRNWRAFALCHRLVQAGQADPSWWDARPDVPDDEAPETKEERTARQEKAMAVCRQCPRLARSFCLAEVKPGRDEGVRCGEVLPEIPAGRPGRKKPPREVSLSA